MWGQNSCTRPPLTPKEEHPPWAPGGGMLDMEGPMPGAPLGNRPKAFRFKPGIRLDWSWMGNENISINTSQVASTKLIL